eukprot:1027066-Pyramimonas_sp.AAC.1
MRQTALETPVNTSQNSASTTSGPSSGGAPGPPSRPGSVANSSYFTPSYIELKGWVTNWNVRTNRSEQMLMWSDSKQIVENVTKSLGEDAATYICPDASERVNAGRFMFGSFNIKFKHGTDHDVIWRVERDIDRVAAAVENRVPPPPGVIVQPPHVLVTGVSQKFEPTLIRVTVECPSWKRDHVKAVS